MSGQERGGYPRLAVNGEAEREMTLSATVDIGPIPPRSCPDIGPMSEKQILSTSGHPVGCRIHGSQRCIVMRHHILHNLIVHIIYIHVECFSGLLTLMLASLFQAELDDFSYEAVYNCACLADYLFSPMKF